MPTPCQKCFTIPMTPPPPFDCMGEATNISTATWTTVHTDAGGSGSVVFAGGGGSFGMTVNNTNVPEAWNTSVTICNPTATQVDINYQIEADIVVNGISASASICSPGTNMIGQCASALSQHISPFGTLSIAPMTISTFTFQMFATCDFGEDADFSGTMVLTQP